MAFVPPTEWAAPRSLAPEAYDCFMARSPRRLHRMQGCGAIVAPTAGLPSVRPRHPAIKSCRALTTPTAVDKWPAAARLLAVALAGHLPTAPTSLNLLQKRKPP